MRGGPTAGIFATDLVDHLGRKGLSFREAHGIAAEAVGLAERSGRRLDRLAPEAAEVPSSGPCGPAARDCVDPHHSVRRKKTSCSTNPDMVRRQLKKARARLDGSV